MLEIKFLAVDLHVLLRHRQEIDVWKVDAGTRTACIVLESRNGAVMEMHEPKLGHFNEGLKINDVAYSESMSINTASKASRCHSA